MFTPGWSIILPEPVGGRSGVRVYKVSGSLFYGMYADAGMLMALTMAKTIGKDH